MPSPLKMALLLLCCSTLSVGLTGCVGWTQRVEQRVEIVTPSVPKALRKCEEAPAWSTYEARATAAKSKISQRDVAEYLAVRDNASMACSTKMKAIDGLLRRIESRK
jgi:uncharacterized iron-regulated membrane protein